MLSRDVKKGWLDELRAEQEGLENICRSLRVRRKTLKERLEVLESVDFSTKDVEIKAENKKELDKTKEDLKQIEETEREKSRRLKFVQELREYVEDEQLRPGT